MSLDAFTAFAASAAGAATAISDANVTRIAIRERSISETRWYAGNFMPLRLQVTQQCIGRAEAWVGDSSYSRNGEVMGCCEDGGRVASRTGQHRKTHERDAGYI